MGVMLIILRLVLLAIQLATQTASMTIDLSSSNIPNVPNNIDPGVTILQLNENQIEEVNSLSFSQLTNLKKLYLFQNGLRFVRDSTFDNNVGLWYLNLNKNDIIQMPTAFGQASLSLTSLFMWGAFGEEISMAMPCLTNVPALTDINLGGNSVEVFSSEIVPQSVMYLRLKYCYMPQFPNLTAPLPNVEQLVGGFNYFVTIPDEFVMGVANVLRLHLDNNLLVSLPDISYFSKLEELYLENNYIPELDELAFTGLVSLWYLSIANNQLGLMPQLNYSVSLRELYLEMNLMQDVPLHSLESLQLIEVMFLHDNLLEHIADISYMTALRDLRLHANSLTTVPDLYELPLVTLTLAENPLVCNKSLCWIRMWPWMKVPITLDDITCESPAHLNDLLLMEVHPVQLHCYQDPRFKHLFMVSYLKHDAGMSVGWNLVEEVTYGARLPARSRIECANLCWAMPSCVGILFDMTNVEPCQILQ